MNTRTPGINTAAFIIVGELHCLFPVHLRFYLMNLGWFAPDALHRNYYHVGSVIHNSQVD